MLTLITIVEWITVMVFAISFGAFCGLAWSRFLFWLFEKLGLISKT